MGAVDRRRQRAQDARTGFGDEAKDVARRYASAAVLSTVALALLGLEHDEELQGFRLKLAARVLLRGVS